jgi:hypothetical protein
VPFPGAEGEAQELQRRLEDLLGHDAATVRPYGQHLLIEVGADETTYTVARFTRLGPRRYGLAFRRHTGRWEPLPVDGTLEEVADSAVVLLAPYFEPENY